MAVTRVVWWLLGLGVVALAFAPGSRAGLGDCSQPVSSGSGPVASDCLFILGAAVGLQSCNPECICDVDGNGSTAATDALRCLASAVGQQVSLDCPCATSTTTTTLPGGGEQPELTSGDFPGVSPCSDRDTLPEDATFRGVLTNTGEHNMIVNFTQFDQDGFPEICGLADADNSLAAGAIPWDPGTPLAPFRGCAVLGDDMRQAFIDSQPTHGPEICHTGFQGSELDAMPRAGVYRRDSCVEFGGNAYDLRTRANIAGPSADQTFAALGIARADVRLCNGTTELRTGAEVRGFLTANPRSRTVSIKSGDCSGTNHLDITTEIVCVKLRSQPCPQHDFGDCPF